MRSRYSGFRKNSQKKKHNLEVDVKMNKAGKMGMEAAVFIVIALVAVQVLGIYDFKGMFGGAATTPAPSGSAQAGAFCAIEDTTYTMTMDDFFNAGTNPTGGSDIAVFIDGVKYDGAYSSGNSITLAPGSKIDVYLYEDATTADTDANTAHWAFTVPCVGVKSDTLKVYDLSSSEGTWIILDDSYTSIKTGTNGYDMSTGQEKVVTLKYTHNNEDAFSASEGIDKADRKSCIVFEANKSLVQKIMYNGKTSDGCKPDGHATDAAKGADAEFWSFKIDPYISTKTYETPVTVELESGDLGEPIAADYTHPINITVHDMQWFYNADNGNMELGYENENDVLIGATALDEAIELQ